MTAAQLFEIAKPILNKPDTEIFLKIIGVYYMRGGLDKVLKMFEDSPENHQDMVLSMVLGWKAGKLANTPKNERN